MNKTDRARFFGDISGFTAVGLKAVKMCQQSICLSFDGNLVPFLATSTQLNKLFFLSVCLNVCV